MESNARCLPSTHNTIESMRTDHNNHSLNDRMAKIGKRGELVDFSYFGRLTSFNRSVPIITNQFSPRLMPHGYYLYSLEVRFGFFVS